MNGQVRILPKILGGEEKGVDLVLLWFAETSLVDL
jgi:hypothetical protein